MVRLLFFLALSALFSLGLGSGGPIGHPAPSELAWDEGQHVPYPAADLCDDDQDDGPPADSGAADDGPDSALPTNLALPFPKTTSRPLAAPAAYAALGPARGTEHPPEARPIRRES
jgi:hypothetical protein